MIKSLGYFFQVLKDKVRCKIAQLYLRNEINKLDKMDDFTLLKRSNLFDYGYYSLRNKLIDFSEDELINHFLNKKNDYKLSPQPLFDCEFYVKKNGIKEIHSSPFIHYLRIGFSKMYEIHPIFSMKNYVIENKWWFMQDGNPLLHYIYNQRAKTIFYNLVFDKGIYLSSFPECLNDQKNPIYHYLRTGYNKVNLPVRTSLDKKINELLNSANFDAATRSYFFNYNPYFNNAPISTSFPCISSSLEKNSSIDFKHINSNISLFENCGIICRYPVLFDDQLNGYLVNNFRNEGFNFIDKGKISKLTLDVSNLGQFVISEAFYFFSGENQSYFEWLTEFMSVILYIEKQDFLKKIPIIIENDLNSDLIDSLLLVLSPARPLIYIYRNKFYKVRKLYYVSTSNLIEQCLSNRSNIDTYYKNIAILKEVSVKIKENFSNRPITPCRKIFLYEKEMSIKFAKNHEMVAEYLKEQNFEMQAVDQLSFIERALLFNEAKCLKLFLSDFCLDMIFMQEKAQIKIFYSEKDDIRMRFYLFLASEFNLDVDFIPVIKKNLLH